MPEIILYTSDPKTQEETIEMEILHNGFVIGLVKDSLPEERAFLTPAAVRKLVEDRVEVLIERGSGKQVYSDMEYASAGGLMLDVVAELLLHCNVALKLTPFSLTELTYVKSHSVLLSTNDLSCATVEYMQILKDKHLTLISLDSLTDRNDEPVFLKLLNGSLKGKSFSIALSECVLPTIQAIFSSRNLRFAIQTYPALIKGVICFQGELCNRQWAEKLNVPCRDILSICWDWN